MKKTISILLTALMSVSAMSALAACNDKQNQSTTSTQSTANDSTTSESTETTVQTTVTAAEWDAALALDRFKNVSIQFKESADNPAATVKLTNEKAYWEFEGTVTVDINGEGSECLTSEDVFSNLEYYIGAFENYTYDEENERYTGKRKNNPENEDLVAFEFENGYLVCFTMLESGGFMAFSDYGTTVIEEAE